MKWLSITGAAIATAAVLVGLAAAGPASATVLCNANVNPCGGGKYPAGTNYKAQLKPKVPMKIINPLGNVSCTEAKMTGKTTAIGGLGLSVPSRISEFKWGVCTREAEACAAPVTVNLGPGLEEQPIGFFVAANPANGSGTLTINASNLGNLGVKIVCGVVINCTFTIPAEGLTVTGGNPAIVTANLALPRAGATCPANATWQAEYEMTEPKPLFLESE